MPPVSPAMMPPEAADHGRHCCACDRALAEVKLIDFGLAMITSHEVLGRSGSVIGSADYLAPEVGKLWNRYFCFGYTGYASARPVKSATSRLPMSGAPVWLLGYFLLDLQKLRSGLSGVRLHSNLWFCDWGVMRRSYMPCCAAACRSGMRTQRTLRQCLFRLA